MKMKFEFDLQRFDEGGAGGSGGGNEPGGAGGSGGGNEPGGAGGSGGEASKTKDDIVAALKGLEGGAQYVAALNKILADGNKATKTIKTMQGEITNITVERDGVSEKLNKLIDFAGIPADTEDLDAKLEELRQAQKENNKAGADAALLQSKINDLTRQNAAMKKERDDHKVVADKRLSRIHSIIKDAEIRKAIGSVGALEGEALVPLFREKVKVLDDETTVYPLDDGSQVTVAEGVKQFFEEHPRLLANNQNPGAGSGGGAAGKFDFNKMSQTEYEKLRKEGKI